MGGVEEKHGRGPGRERGRPSRLAPAHDVSQRLEVFDPADGLRCRAGLRHLVEPASQLLLLGAQGRGLSFHLAQLLVELRRELSRAGGLCRLCARGGPRRRSLDLPGELALQRTGQAGGLEPAVGGDGPGQGRGEGRRLPAPPDRGVRGRFRTPDERRDPAVFLEPAAHPRHLQLGGAARADLQVPGEKPRIDPLGSLVPGERHERRGRRVLVEDLGGQPGVGQVLLAGGTAGQVLQNLPPLVAVQGSVEQPGNHPSQIVMGNHQIASFTLLGAEGASALRRFVEVAPSRSERRARAFSRQRRVRTRRVPSATPRRSLISR